MTDAIANSSIAATHQPLVETPVAPPVSEAGKASTTFSEPSLPISAPRNDAPVGSRLSDYATRIDLSSTKPDDLVLHSQSAATFDRLESRVNQQPKLLRDWAFATRGGGQPGLSALFVGATGHGKSLAARVLATRLNRPLYSVDLSQLLGDNVAQTLRNLGRVVDLAAMERAVLLIEDVEALLVDTSRDRTDRDAQLLATHLAHKLRSQAGLVILTSQNGNLPSGLHGAIAEQIHFPFPEARLRSEIWKRAFPAGTPVDTLPLDRIGNHNLSGGQIASAAMRAAALASAAQRGVSVDDIKEAVRAELIKTGRMSDSREFNY